MPAIIGRFPWQCGRCGHHTDRHIYGGPGFEECRDCDCAGYLPSDTPKEPPGTMFHVKHE